VLATAVSSFRDAIPPRRHTPPALARVSQEAVVYAINLIIGAILAGVMSQYWRLESGGVSLRWWVVAAWTLTAADLLFTLRAMFPEVVPRPLSTLTVTAGHVVLVLAAQTWVGRKPMTRAAIAVVALHGVALLGYIAMPSLSGWRAVTNGIGWGALSIGAAVTLWSGAPQLRRMMFLPAMVLASQGVFHAVRSLLATRAVVQPGEGLSEFVQLLGDLEVSLFMVALFVGVLVAFLRQGNAELRAALDNVQRLSTMLPLCAWCHKVRDDSGYWTRIEEYLAEHKVNVTHALCESCAAQHFEDSVPRGGY